MLAARPLSCWRNNSTSCLLGSFFARDGAISHAGELMITIHPGYIVDENSNRKAVVIPYSEWEKIVRDLEELDDVRAYDTAKAEIDEVVLFKQAVKEIEGDVLK